MNLHACQTLKCRNDYGQLGLGDDRGRWRPEELRGFKAVHPDRTLRKNKRALPRMRPIMADEGAGAGSCDKGITNAALFDAASKPRVESDNEREAVAAAGSKEQAEAAGARRHGATPRDRTPLPAGVAADSPSAGGPASSEGEGSNSDASQ
jgi:hypothetical protein